MMKKTNTKRSWASPESKMVNSVKAIVILFLLHVFSLTNSVFAQTKTIRGKITDEKGLGLPGASVTIRGTTTGVSTDAEGNYTLSASPANTLVISFIRLR